MCNRNRESRLKSVLFPILLWCRCSWPSPTWCCGPRSRARTERRGSGSGRRTRSTSAPRETETAGREAGSAAEEERAVHRLSAHQSPAQPAWLAGWLAVASAAWGLRSRLAEPPQASEEALLDGLTGSNMCPDDWSHSSIPLHHGWLERTTTNNSFQSLQCNSFSISLPKLPKNEQVISSTCTPTSQSTAL